MKKKILKIGPNQTGKWVVEVMSSHLVFFLYKMGHSTTLPSPATLIKYNSFGDGIFYFHLTKLTWNWNFRNILSLPEIISSTWNVSMLWNVGAISFQKIHFLKYIGLKYHILEIMQGKAGDRWHKTHDM